MKELVLKKTTFLSSILREFIESIRENRFLAFL
jgi:hypothetical protein